MQMLPISIWIEKYGLPLKLRKDNWGSDTYFIAKQVESSGMVSGCARYKGVDLPQVKYPSTEQMILCEQEKKKSVSIKEKPIVQENIISQGKMTPQDFKPAVLDNQHIDDDSSSLEEEMRNFYIVNRKIDMIINREKKQYQDYDRQVKNHIISRGPRASKWHCSAKFARVTPIS